MARKPASHFEVVPIEQALPLIEPPAHLSGAEKALFHSIVQQSAAQNFTIVRSPLRSLPRSCRGRCAKWLLHSDAWNMLLALTESAHIAV